MDIFSTSPRLCFVARRPCPHALRAPTPRARSLGMGSLTTLGTSDSEWHSRAANTGSAARFCLCSVCLRLNINECALVSFIHQTFSQR